jgi:rare lipoprotein A
MNQHRWTHATIVVLTTVLAPIANVCAQTSAPVTPGTGIYPQRPLPIITPLTVTELETDVAVPKAPAISSLGNIPSDFAQPIAAPVAPLVRADSRQSAVAKPAKLPSPQQISSTKKIAVKPSIFVSGVLQPQNPPQTPVTTPVFAIDNPGNSFVAQPGSTTDTTPTAPIGEVAPLENQSQAFTVQADSKPLLVIRRGSLRATKIINTATIQAEVTRLPQSAPSIKQTDDIPDTIGFEAGTPTFVFDSERPQQIIATAIAQVGDTTVAPEPSIAIPVQRPNQPTLPTQSPLPAVAPIPTVAPIPAQPTGAIQPPQAKVVAIQTGQASWYGIEGGPKTANGERYNPEGLTAAHRTLPFGTKVRVTSLKTGLAVTLRINDRGPFHSRRILDVSAGAAAAIGIKNDGIGEVKMEILGNEG